MSLSAPVASPSLSGCFSSVLAGAARVPAGEQSRCPGRRRGRPWAEETRKEPRGLAWLGLVFRRQSSTW